MGTWTAEDLDRIGAAKELDIATERRDGTLRSYLPIWVVRIGDDLYVRAYRGRGGSWFRQVQRHPRASIRAGGVERSVSFVEADDDLRAAIDEAYRAKYGSGMYVDAMVAPSAAEAALKMVP